MPVLVVVTWHGHACVSITLSNGYTIVIDPHDGASLGLKPPSVKGDLVLVTHTHFDHNAVEVVKKDKSRVLIEFAGESKLDNVVVKGFQTFHDKQQGRRRGRNYIYLIEAEGARIAHLGDLGHVPGEDVLDSLKGIDLLIPPVGGTFTIDAREAWEIVEKTKPVNIMPIHYWIKGCNLPLAPVDEFLKLVKGYEITRLGSNSFKLEDYRNKVILPAPP
ncbi:MBL fold metallo-hydrolase [Thermogladius sp. 4427co]|uniref:MBL fold metallo-hydrolase n=1 Tax=Thermogladius sp. 4427co TaxID=3450718 RepID=UPI003F79680E